MKKISIILLLLCFAFSICSCSFSNSITSGTENADDSDISASESAADDTAIIKDDAPLAADFAESYEEILSVLTGEASIRYGSYPGGDADPDGNATVISANSLAGGTSCEVQLERTVYSGGLMYLLRGGSLYICEDSGSGAELLSETVLFTESYSEGGENDDPNHYAYGSESAEGIYVFGDRAAVVTSSYRYSEDFDESSGQWQYNESQRVNIISLDISDARSPVVSGIQYIDGTFCGAYSDSGSVYVVTSVFVKALDSDIPESFIPSCSRGGDNGLLSPVDILILPENTCSGYTVVAGFDVSSGEITAARAVLGGLGRLYADKDAVYMVFSSSSLRESQSYTQSVYTVVDYLESTSSQIVRVSFDDSLSVSSIYADGCPGSEFFFTVMDGSFILGTVYTKTSYGIYTDTEKGWSNREDYESSFENLIYTVSADFSAANAVPFLPDESVTSLRFFGESAYAETGNGLFSVSISDGTAVQSNVEIPCQILSFGDNLLAGIYDDMSVAVINSADMTPAARLDVSDISELSELCVLPEYGLIAVPSDGVFRIFTYDKSIVSAAAAVPYSGMQSNCALLCSGSAVYAVSDSVVTLSYPELEEFSSLELISDLGQLG